MNYFYLPLAAKQRTLQVIVKKKYYKSQVLETTPIFHYIIELCIK